MAAVKCSVGPVSERVRAWPTWTSWKGVSLMKGELPGYPYSFFSLSSLDGSTSVVANKINGKKKIFKINRQSM